MWKFISIKRDEFLYNIFFFLEIKIMKNKEVFGLVEVIVM